MEIVAEFLPASIGPLMKIKTVKARKTAPFEPIKHSKVPIQVQVTKIEYKGKKVGEKDEEAIAAMSTEEKAEYDLAMEKAPLEIVPVWDNSQKSVVYNDEGEKSEEVPPEPDQEVLEMKKIVERHW